MPALQRKLGDVLRDLVVELDAPLLDKLHHGHAGERQHRADDVVDRFVLGRRLESEVGETVSLVEQHLAALRDEHGRADDMLLRHHTLDRGIQIGRGALRTACRGGKGREGGGERDRTPKAMRIRIAEGRPRGSLVQAARACPRVILKERSD